MIINWLILIMFQQVSPRYDQLVDYQTTRGDQRFIGDRDHRHLVKLSQNIQFFMFLFQNSHSSTKFRISIFNIVIFKYIFKA